LFSAFRNLERVEGYTGNLVPVAAAITLWVTCAGVVRVQGNAAVAEEAAVPIEFLSFGLINSGAALIVVATIDDMGGAARIAPGKSPCACGLSEKDTDEGCCDVDLHGSVI